MYFVNDGTSAHATLPTQEKSTLLLRVPTHAYTDCEISGRQPTRLYKEFPRIHNAGHSKKNDAHMRELYAGACILYVYSSLHSYHNQRLKMGGEVAGFSWCQCLV